MSNVLENLDLSGLTSDGDTIDLPDGRKLRLRIEPDESHFDDISEHGDCYGRTQWTRPDRYRDRAPRPDGFDGAAKVIRTDGDAKLWWQPPADLRSFRAWGGDDPALFARVKRDLERLVGELCEFGFLSVGLELLDGQDAYHRAIVRDASWMGGVEPPQGPDNDYLSEIISELADELSL